MSQFRKITYHYFCHIWLGTDIFKCRKWWIGPGFIALHLSRLRKSHQIPLYLQRCVNKTDKIGISPFDNSYSIIGICSSDNSDSIKEICPSANNDNLIKIDPSNKMTGSVRRMANRYKQNIKTRKLNGNYPKCPLYQFVPQLILEIS